VSARDADDRLYRDDNHKPEIIVAPERRVPRARRPPARRADAAASRCCRAHRVHWGAALERSIASTRSGGDGRGDEQVLRAALAWALSEATPDDVAQPPRP
jgi:mannose-6-phosphate isomerase